MPAFNHAHASHAANHAALNPVLARALWQWLVVGVLALLLVPAARGNSAWFGPMSYWLVLAPLASLLVLYRHTLVAAWRGILVPAPRRHQPRHRGSQARRSGFAIARSNASQRAA